MESTLTTEERIRQAAKKVFLEKGFEGTTTRDIAAEAEINLALLNYYFRSKQKLFDLVFEEMLQLYFSGMKTLLNQPVSLREKITALIDHDFRMLRQRPDLVLFIQSELHRNPDRYLESIIGAQAESSFSLLDEQLKESYQAGLIRPISAAQLLGITSANTQFVFINKNVHMKLWKQTEAQFEEYINEYKKLICDMIVHYLFIT